MKKITTVISFFVFITIFSSVSFSQGKKVTFGIGANVPMGDFGNVYKAGPSAQLGFIFLSLPAANTDLSVSAEYNSFSYKNEYFTQQVKTNLGVGTTGFTPDWKATDFSIMAGARLKMQGLVLKPYGEAQVGVHFMNFDQRLTGKIIGSSSDPSNISLNGATETASETGFSTALGIGTEISVAPKFSFDLGLKYNYAMIKYSNSYTVFLNNNSQYTTLEMKNASFLTVRGGIIVSF